ncbi:MAG TPA: DUF6444 domain-containing protein [Rhabdochlamydiaceae bacterium]|nr:DUF6444 domain-containing protein [Rhabdochlamydiaceae bacterium]
MNASYEELLAEISALGKENAELKERVGQLEEQLKLNPKNSSKPPSTDREGTDDVPKKKGRAKPGHPGHFRPIFSTDRVDAFFNLREENFPSCEKTMERSGDPISIHQQVEIAPKPYVVTQYNRESFYCPFCKKYGVAPIPDHVGPLEFGTRLSAFMGFLNGTCRLIRRKGLDLRAAIGTQSNVDNRISGGLKSSYEEIKKQVCSRNETKQIDETSWKLWGKSAFVVMLEYLKMIFELWRDYRAKLRSRRSFRRKSRQYRYDLGYGLLVASTKCKHSPSLKRFAQELLRKARNLWFFVTRDGVEPTSNQVERNLSRGIVITRRISYGSKSERCDWFIKRINSVVTALKLQEKKCLAYLTEALGACKAGSSTLTIFSQPSIPPEQII